MSEELDEVIWRASAQSERLGVSGYVTGAWRIAQEWRGLDMLMPQVGTEFPMAHRERFLRQRRRRQYRRLLLQTWSINQNKAQGGPSLQGPERKTPPRVISRLFSVLPHDVTGA